MILLHLTKRPPRGATICVNDETYGSFEQTQRCEEKLRLVFDILHDLHLDGKLSEMPVLLEGVQDEHFTVADYVPERPLVHGPSDADGETE